MSDLAGISFDSAESVGILTNLSRIEGDQFIEHLMRIAPEVSEDESQVWVLAVDTVILALTLLGAFFIIGRLTWNELKRHAATTRVRLVQSLIFTDVVMGITGLIGCGLMLNDKPLVLDTPMCDGLGVTMVAVIFSQHLWTLSLAVATFMILVHPLHSLTSWIEKYWFWLWPIVWAISFAISLLGYFLYGYGPSGGICYYQNNSGLFAELIQFLPRAIVFLVIACLYGKLYVFLRRPDKIRSGYSDSPSQSSASKLKGSWFKGRGSRISRSVTAAERSDGGGWFGRGYRTVILDGHGHIVGGNSSAAQTSDSSKPIEAGSPETSKLETRPRISHLKSNRAGKRNTMPPASDLPPWEHVELPVFQVDGETFGGAEYHPPSQDNRMWRDWHGFPGRKRQSAPNSISSLPQSPITSPTKGLFDKPPLISPNTTLREGKISPTTGYFDGTLKQTYPSASAYPSNIAPVLSAVTEDEGKPVARSIGSVGTVASLTTTAVDSSAPQSPKTPKDASKEVTNNSPPSGRRSVELSASFSSGVAPDAEPSVPRSPPLIVSPVPTSRDVATLMYEGFDPSRRGSIPDGTLAFRRASGFALPAGFPLPSGYSQTGSSFSRGGTPRSTIPGNINDLPRASTPGSSIQASKDVEKGGVDGDEDDSEDDDDDAVGTWDLMRMLKEPPPTGDKDPFAIQTNASENHEYVQESMASYLNRKTALLMLWFPLGYVLLFSVSTIRIIYDFVGDPPIELRAISRWMMFGQGLLDAFIYGIVEWHTKRVVRKRVRKGTFSPHASRGHSGQGHSGHHHSGLANKIRQLAHIGHHNHSQPHHHTANGNEGGGNTQTASVQCNTVTSPTVSFIDPEKSILQRLDEGRELSGSSAESRV